MHLRPYQQDLLIRLTQARFGARRILLQAPTGSGKTALAVHVMAEELSRGGTCYFVVHRHELLEQTSRALEAAHVPHGLVKAGYPQRRASVQVASLQTVRRRLSRLTEPSLICLDEAHRSLSTSYRQILRAWPHATVIGLTATPARTDGQPLRDLFDTLIIGPTIRELIDQGYLAEHTVYAPSHPDTSGVRVQGGEYVRSDLEQVTDRPTITGDAIAHYERLAGHARAIVFCVSRTHAKHTAQRFQEAGHAAQAIDGATDQATRRQALRAFRAGTIRVLVGVDLFIEGLDVPDASVAVVLRPTTSVIVWLQACGRVLRPGEAKQALILDHAGNVFRHGLPDDSRDWSLEGRAKGERATRQDRGDLPVVLCEMCFAMIRPAPVCPLCGAQRAVKGREVREQAGELEAVRALERGQRRQAIGRARTLEDLVAVAQQQGYKPGWAAFLFAQRQGRKPTAEEFQRATQLIRQPAPDACP